MFGLGLTVLEVPVAYRGWENCHEENNSVEIHSSHSSPSLFFSATIKRCLEDARLPRLMGSDLGEGPPSLKEAAEEQGTGLVWGEV